MSALVEASEGDLRRSITALQAGKTGALFRWSAMAGPVMAGAAPGPLDEFETGYLIREVLIGLHFIYQRNVIHRDFSADNILMDSFGNLFISDFGQAAMLSNRRPVRDSIKGKPGLADPRLE